MTRKKTSSKAASLSVILFAATLLFTTPATSQDTAEANTSCSQTIALLEEQNQKLSREFRSIKREIAALRQDLEKPGVKEASAGIGYILGLFGAGALVMAHKKNRATSKDRG